MSAKKGSIVFDLVLGDKEFLQQLGLTKKEVQGFSSNVSSAMGVVGKLAAALGAGATAYEVFNKAVHSSQATSDAWENSISAAKTTVDRFFTSLVTGDWTPFLNGLQNTINKALEAARAMDQLGNTKMSFNFASSEANALIQDAMAILSDPNASKAEREEAQRTLDENISLMEDMVGQYSTDAMNAIKTRLSADTGIAPGAITEAMVKKFFMLDAQGNRDKIKGELDKQLDGYDSVYAEVVKKHTHQIAIKGQYGNNIITNQVDWSAVSRDMEPYMYQNAEALVYRAMIKNWEDKTLQDNMGIMQDVFNARRGIASTKRRAGRSMNLGIVTAPNANTTDTQTPVGTMNVLNARLSELKEQLASSSDPILMKTLQVQIMNTENELSKLKEGLSLIWSKGDEIAAPGYDIPAALQGFTGENGSEIEAYTGNIEDLSSALDALFSTMRGGEIDMRAFLGLFGNVLGAFGGPAGGIAGSIINGIGGLLRNDTVTPTVTVRGSDLSIALKNYNNRMS